MPKGKIKHHKTSTNQLIYPETDQNYGKVDKPLGNSQFLVELLNGDKVSCKIRGALQTGSKCGERISPENWVIVQKINEQPPYKYQIFHKYDAKDIKILTKQGLLQKVEQESEEKENDLIQFGNDGDGQVAEKEENLESFIDGI